MYRLPFFLLLLLLGISHSKAQLNESDTARLQIKVLSGGIYQRGNVELLRISSQLDLSTRLSKQFVFKTQNNHLYQAFFGNRADDDWMSRNYLYYQPRQKWYPYAIGFISTNFRRKIARRTFAGAGLTYQLLQKEGKSLKISGNLLYEQSRYANLAFNFPEFDGIESIEAMWSTLYLSGAHAFQHPALQLNYELYWQQSLARAINYRYHVVVGVEYQLFKGLALQTRLIYAWEQLTAEAVQQEDLFWTWGLSYRFRSSKK